MAKKILVKDKEHHLAIAIKENFNAGMRQKDIAALFKISKQRVNYWDIMKSKKEKED